MPRKDLQTADKRFWSAVLLQAELWRPDKASAAARAAADIDLELEVIERLSETKWARQKALAKRRTPADRFDPSRLELIGGTARTGLVPRLMLQRNFAKTLACGHRYGSETGRKWADRRGKPPFSVQQNGHFNDGLCLDATHNKSSPELAAVSHLCFWHHASFFFFLLMKTKQSN